MKKKMEENLFRRQAKEPRRQFLEEEQYEEMTSDVAARECCGDAFYDFDGHTDDAWLMQCPKGTDPLLIAGKRIKLPGRKSIGDLQADEKILEVTAKMWRTANYYNIRSKLLNTTQTLEQKENDVRQSVLTGRTPQFMKATIIPDLFAEKEIEEKVLTPAGDASPAKRRKKYNSDGHEKGEILEENAIANKKKKKHKSNH
ncbi:uncharacterized protein LOC122622870 isoform X2 [Drosophila teissieri]|uniref:uncharacterized protein LOC122622870 isoform X2 n=1 Tax=Drosophila teissieri TaxID=7243 RepID=UPI001CB9EBC5|nr:uncharacterized protein LOC122622870 isoform X2 [Drosophila teissieri]